MQVVRGDGAGRLEPLDHVPEAAELSLVGQATEAEYPMVLAEWHDAWFDFDQPGPEGCRTDYLVRTVGFLVGRGPSFISLAQEILPDGEGFRAVTHIPIPIVERVVWLDLAEGLTTT